MNITQLILTIFATLSWMVGCAPMDVTTFDLTGQEFSSECGQIGVFLSGTVHSLLKSECTTKKDVFSCKLQSQFVFSNARVSIGGTEYIVTNVNRLVSSFSTSPGTFETNLRRILVANLIQPGNGIVQRFFGNLKCHTVNGVTDCKVDTFIMEC